MNQFDIVKLVIKQNNIKSGSIGVIVYCYNNDDFEVEFNNKVITVNKANLELITKFK